jgi:hypothetical protein
MLRVEREERSHVETEHIPERLHPYKLAVVSASDTYLAN